jgi:hypothetical protein
MAHDPLADLTVPIPAHKLAESGGDPAQVQALQAEELRLRLIADARKFITHDALMASPYARMSPTEQRRHADLHGIPNHRKITDETDLCRVLAFCDLYRAQNRMAPLAPYPIEAPETRPATPAVKVRHLPMSDTNQWRVAKTADASMPGGVFRIHEGTIYKLEEVGADLLESLAAQGVQLEPYPTAPARHSCPECGTSWPVSMPGKGTLPDACPTCHLMGGGGSEGALAEAGAQLAALETRHAELVRWVDERHGALVRWAVDQGALPPDKDGTWQGEPHPPPLPATLAQRDPNAPNPPPNEEPDPLPEIADPDKPDPDKPASRRRGGRS